jgi:hypothetical protein
MKTKLTTVDTSMPPNTAVPSELREAAPARLVYQALKVERRVDVDGGAEAQGEAQRFTPAAARALHSGLRAAQVRGPLPHQGERLVPALPPTLCEWGGREHRLVTAGCPKVEASSEEEEPGLA